MYSRLLLPFLMIFLLSSQAVDAQDRMMFVKNDKNPGIAFSLSLFTPGVGQMYNDQVYLGLGVFFGTLALYGAGAVMTQNLYTRGTNNIAKAMLVTGGLVHLSSMIYAPIKARQINRANGDTAFLEKKRKSEFAIGMTSIGGAGFTLAF